MTPNQVKILNKEMLQSCSDGNLNLVKTYIKLGANINHDNHKAIINASARGHLAIVKYLHQKSRKMLQTHREQIFTTSMINGYTKIITYMIETGITPKIDTKYIQQITKYGYLFILKSLEQKLNGFSEQTKTIILMTATSFNKLHIIKYYTPKDFFTNPIYNKQIILLMLEAHKEKNSKILHYLLETETLQKNSLNI